MISRKPISVPKQPKSSVKTSNKQVLPAVLLATTPQNVAVEMIPPSPAALPSPEPTLESNTVSALLTEAMNTSQHRQVTLIYEQYNEKFPISNGSITSDAIDEVYCLSFVMEGCRIHLSKHTPLEKRSIEIQGDEQQLQHLYLVESESLPQVVYHGSVDGETYYVYVDQDEVSLLREQEEFIQRQTAKTDNHMPPITTDDGRGMKSCTCIYGTPCIDEFGCQDWKSRFSVATTNGWLGFESLAQES